MSDTIKDGGWFLFLLTLRVLIAQFPHAFAFLFAYCIPGMIATGGTVDAWNTLAKEDILDPYAALPVLPMTCASASCSQSATFSDAQGTAKCVCNRGFEGDGKVCKDIDECIFSPCGPASVCVNTVGSYQCKCRKGFQQTQEACIDIDECSLGSQNLIPLPCPLQAQCYNFSGTFDCICPRGTAWNGISGPAAQCLRISEVLQRETALKT